MTHNNGSQAHHLPSDAEKDDNLPLARAGGDDGGFIDLCHEDAGPPLRIEVRRYRPDRDRERMRGNVAAIFTGLVAFMVVAAFGFLAAGYSFENVQKLYNLVFTPVLALTSSVTAYYFGAQSRSG